MKDHLGREFTLVPLPVWIANLITVLLLIAAAAAWHAGLWSPMDHLPPEGPR